MSDPQGVTIASLALDFSLPSQDGTEVRLADFRLKKNVVLFFIREYI